MVSARAGPRHPPRAPAIPAPPRPRTAATPSLGPPAPTRGGMADTEPGLPRPAHRASVPAGSSELRGEGRAVSVVGHSSPGLE